MNASNGEVAWKTSRLQNRATISFYHILISLVPFPSASDNIENTHSSQGRGLFAGTQSQSQSQITTGRAQYIYTSGAM